MFRNTLQKCGNSPIFTPSRRYIKRMQEHGIVPDVIPTLPQLALDIKYGDKKVDMGNILTPRMVRDIPSVSWKFETKTFYTLIMVDPDSPSRKKPKYREWHHWLLGNIEKNDLQGAEELSEYIGAIPAKRSGLHRYVFLLFKQPGKVEFRETRWPNLTLDGRSMFSAMRFSEKYKLGNPIGGNFFQAEWDKSVPKLKRRLSRFNFILSKVIKD